MRGVEPVEKGENDAVLGDTQNFFDFVDRDRASHLRQRRQL
jgi:hypothetical protein